MAELEKQAWHKTLPLKFCMWSDGNQQWARQANNVLYLYIERVLGEKSRRKRWCIVSRALDSEENIKYPPKVAGPFPNIKAAMAAYMLMIGGA